MIRETILEVYELADFIDRQEGMVAYWNYNRTMKLIAHQWQRPLPAVVGAFCALSPNNDYMGNLRSLITLLKALHLSLPETSATVSTYNACRGRAWRCLKGEDFLSFTAGPKTRNFYQSIMDPDDPQAVTIDGHMFGVWSGQRRTMKKIAEEGFNYAEVALDFRHTALYIGILPSQLQAVCWFAWKRIHRVVYNPQLGLFSTGDQWGLLPDVETINTFRLKEIQI